MSGTCAYLIPPQSVAPVRREWSSSEDSSGGFVRAGCVTVEILRYIPAGDWGIRTNGASVMSVTVHQQSHVTACCCLLHAFSQLRRARWPNRSARLLYRATRAHEPDLLTRQTKAEFVLRNSTEILRGGGSIRNFWVTGGRGATCSPLNQRCETKAVPR